MKINEFLTEAVSSKIYHFTSIRNAFKILKQKQFNLATSAGTSQEQLRKDRLFYLSTSRSPSADYAIQNVYKFGAMLNLNGDWFNQRYKGKAVDYWERMWWSSAEGKTIGGRTSEQEDRIFSDKPVIKFPENPTDVIQSVHLLVDTGKDFERVSGQMRGILIECKKYGIPVYVYTDKNSWSVQDTRKTIPISELKPKLSGEVPAERWRQTDWFKEWRELYHKKDYDQLSKKAKDVLYKIFTYSDTPKSLEVDIHNMKTNITPPLARLLDIFKKLKISTAKEYVEYLKGKWKDYLK